MRDPFSLLLKSEGGWSDNPLILAAMMKGVTLAHFRRYLKADTKDDLRKIH
ncbi:hypothetical protein [Mesorhizobium sp. M2E.F.Ca.ET.219.01.1.1]|uniref:hypothetical protein n=1 Tax=Mesorhizobium sp. M2E.F.Ca.ET.219.01.1.1 TaxID=2500530 RepID=UPI00187D5D64|nr:hypothetical protein [Mesorhizobium sp. M2E.F.Ca.ET.219.01.1.1]